MNVQGLAILGCGVTVEGRLRNCAVDYEDPVGWGFADTAVAVAPYFRIKKPASGNIVEGHIVIPLLFALPDAPQDKAMTRWHLAILLSLINNHQCSDAKGLVAKYHLGPDEQRRASECTDPSPWQTDGATF